MEGTTPLLHQIPEVCRMLGIGRSMLYELIASGRLLVVKIGARTLVPADEVQRLASELVAKARAKAAAQ